ncbi:MAG: proline dehydrogenase [bacterium]|nr:proline dehydrogenase [bacterium]
MGKKKESLRRFLGARHVVGLRIDEAVTAAAAEAQRGNRATLGYLAARNESPDAIGAHHLSAIQAIAAADLDSSISIKVDKLEYDRDVLFPVIEAAMNVGVRVHFDAQAYESADPTFTLFEEALDLGADVSATLPSRWQRSVEDAERLIELGVPVRVVKGQAEDPTNPKIDPRRSFVDLVEQLAGRVAAVGIATHDRRVAEPAFDLLQAAGTPCSLEQLAALPRLDAVFTTRGIPVTVYVAYGESGLPYALNQVFKRPAILGWVIRDLVVRRQPQGAIR